MEIIIEQKTIGKLESRINVPEFEKTLELNGGKQMKNLWEIPAERTLPDARVSLTVYG
jgi:hypothetical protein